MTRKEHFMEDNSELADTDVIACRCAKSEGYVSECILDCEKCWNTGVVEYADDDAKCPSPEYGQYICSDCEYHFVDGDGVDRCRFDTEGEPDECGNTVACQVYNREHDITAGTVDEEESESKKTFEDGKAILEGFIPRIGNPGSKIKDSGARREFETGAVRDIQEGKGRCDLLPLDAIHDLLRYKEMCDPEGIGDVFMDIELFRNTGNKNFLYNALSHCCIFGDPFTMFLEVSKHFEEGAKKYGEYNWQKGIPTHCYIDSAVRHYLKYLRGDTDEPHDRAFVWNILCCIWTCIHKPELNDYKKEG